MTKRPGWYREGSRRGPANTYLAEDGTIYRCRRSTESGTWNVDNCDEWLAQVQTLRAAREYVEYITSVQE